MKSGLLKVCYDFRMNMYSVTFIGHFVTYIWSPWTHLLSKWFMKARLPILSCIDNFQPYDQSVPPDSLLSFVENQSQS